ncbi:hypothetical protein TSAR_015231 [Trichomalopsis sarcophagae]|uniref:Uncharacterized protein n=1 Tax=Trichomalopsis sarcophagae TaxID=543379 RepID=A0A232EDX9_9HYME|nr:hypothetical protein TSAR_015231 [Trichomalopsis sarcophagae]
MRIVNSNGHNDYSNGIEWFRKYFTPSRTRCTFDIIERYFGSEEKDSKITPSVDSQGQQFQFPTVGIVSGLYSK